MRTLIFTVAIVLMASSLYAASNWRYHGKVCNNNTACMKEQAKAKDLWTGQNWDDDLKRTCDHHLQMYNKEYIAAVNCVAPLQLARQEYRLNRLRLKEIESRGVKSQRRSSYYRRDGRIMVVH